MFCCILAAFGPALHPKKLSFSFNLYFLCYLLDYQRPYEEEAENLSLTRIVSSPVATGGGLVGLAHPKIESMKH